MRPGEGGQGSAGKRSGGGKRHGNSWCACFLRQDLMPGCGDYTVFSERQRDV